MKRLLCWFSIHRWGPMQHLDSLNIHYRQCERCGVMTDLHKRNPYVY